MIYEKKVKKRENEGEREDSDTWEGTEGECTIESTAIGSLTSIDILNETRIEYRRRWNFISAMHLNATSLTLRGIHAPRGEYEGSLSFVISLEPLRETGRVHLSILVHSPKISCTLRDNAEESLS